MYRAALLGAMTAMLPYVCEAAAVNDEFIRYQISGNSDIVIDDIRLVEQEYVLSAFARRDDVVEKFGGSQYVNSKLFHVNLSIEEKGEFPISDHSVIELYVSDQIGWFFGESLVIFDDWDKATEFRGFDLTNNFRAFDPLLASNNSAGNPFDGGLALPIVFNTTRGKVVLALSNIRSDRFSLPPGSEAIRSPGTFTATIVPLPPALLSFGAAISALWLARGRASHR